MINKMYIIHVMYIYVYVYLYSPIDRNRGKKNNFIDIIIIIYYILDLNILERVVKHSVFIIF